jgi:hypothetical protein
MKEPSRNRDEVALGEADRPHHLADRAEVGPLGAHFDRVVRRFF